jgi:hypothetical protein
MSDAVAKSDQSETSHVTAADAAAASSSAAFQSELRNTTIILMRHAEKPDDPNNPDLAPAGFARAKELADYIPEHFARTPDYLFASKDSDNSSRPRETLEPLSEKIGVPIDTSVKDKNYAELAQELNDPKFDGKFIAIAWHHGKIPQLAQALGAPDGSYPAKWNGKVFDQILEFDFDQDGHESVKTITEDFAHPKN